MKLTKFFLFVLMATLTLTACRKDKSENKKQTITNIEVPTQDAKQEVEKVEEAVASANFETNDYFETFIAKNKSNTDIINIDKPKMGGELMPKGDKVKLEINGYWANGKNAKEISLEVYPNIFEEGTDNRAIIEQKLKLTQENKYLIFGYLQHVSLDEGLYYYFLKNGKTIIYTGKFLVK